MAKKKTVKKNQKMAYMEKKAAIASIIANKKAAARTAGRAAVKTAGKNDVLKVDTSKETVAKKQMQSLRQIVVKNAEGDPDTVAEILIQNKIDYTPKVSVIMPVYNVEPYLRECLDSVINQTLKEIEIICVDDGSTDNSLEILKEYAAKDERITLVAPGHIGSGRCRNIALSMAKGNYIGFVDPDDYVEFKYFEKLYIATLNASPDIVFQTSRVEFYPDGTQIVVPTTQNPNEMNFRFNIVQESGHLWSKIFNADFIKKYNLRNAHTRRSQDLMFTVPAILFAEEIKCIDDAKYYYRKGHISVTSKSFYTEEDINEQFDLYKNLEEKILQFKPEYSFFIKYKCNLIFKKIYKEASFELRHLIADKISMDYFTDFDCSIKACTKTIALKNPSPDKIDKLWWGDYWLGLDLEQGLKQEGFNARTDYYEEWKDALPADINFVIRGPKQLNTFNYDKINVLYLMSFLGACSDKELDNYDIIIVASERFKNIRKDKKVYYLPQFTNPDRFYPEIDEACKTDVLFVGNAYANKFRPAVKYAVKNDLPISVYGKFWEKLIDAKYIKGTFIDNNRLHKYYSNAAIVLNDTTDEMRENGIISNRIFDVTACKGFVISDYVPEIRNLYGDAVPMYKNEKEMVSLVNYYLAHPEERRKKAEQAYQITLKNCTNKVFAKKLHDILDKHKKTMPKLDYKYILSDWYQRTTGKYLDLYNPKTYNEKIQWLKLYDSTPIKTRLADKYLVRDWVKERIGEQYLIPLLGVYDKFEDINFDELPEQFVIKCNHGCGYNIIVKDKLKLDLQEVQEKIDKWLDENWAFKAGFEFHYRDINPKIIIEKFIENRKAGDLYDYKFWCFNGHVEYIQFLSERNLDGLKMAFYDRNWKKQKFVYSYPLDTKIISKPDNLDHMIQLAEKLAKDFGHIRVDFYRLDDGTVYFGELTFSSATGTCIWNDKAIDEYFGKAIKLPKLAYNFDTGKYYKAPKINYLTACLAFPYYYFKMSQLNKKYLAIVLDKIVVQLSQSRIDIKNIGNKSNNVNISGLNKAKITSPAYLCNDKGIGKVIQCDKLKNQYTLSVVQDGILKFTFKSIDKRVNGKKEPIWIDYKSIKIDGKEILSKPISTWHDKTYLYEIPVKDGQKIVLEVEQKYHEYLESDLKDLILRLYSNNNYIRKNIHTIVSELEKTFPVIDEEIYKERQKEKEISEILNILTMWRLDIKNIGTPQNSIEVSSIGGKITTPNWFTNEQGVGKTIIGNTMCDTIKLKTVNNGILKINFKSTDTRVNGEKIPIWADYKSIKIDGQELLSEPIVTWHDNPYTYEMSVKDGQEITLEVEQQYHQYREDEFKNLINKLNIIEKEQLTVELIDAVYQKMVPMIKEKVA